MKGESGPLLQVRDLVVRYGDLTALEGVSLELPVGGIIAVLGANGAGKSTLLKALAGGLRPARGEILHRGERIDGLESWRVANRGISYVPEGRRVFPNLTVLENLLVGGSGSRACPNRKTTLEKVCSLFPRLRERSSQMGSELSGGEQQMLAIGRALMSEPEAILFDEVSLGLSPLVVKQIYNNIVELNREGVSVALVDQDVRQCLKVAGYVYVLRQGRVVLEGEPKNLAEPAVRAAFMGRSA